MRAIHSLPSSYSNALHVLLERVSTELVSWVLTGSAGLRLQGVYLPVNDLDVQSNRFGVIEIAHRLVKAVRKAPLLKENSGIRSYFGLLEVAGVLVEIMGDLQYRRDDGSWTDPVDVVAHRHWVIWEGWQVPVLDLAHEADAYARMGRVEKAAAIRAVMTSNIDGFDE